MILSFLAITACTTAIDEALPKNRFSCTDSDGGQDYSTKGGIDFFEYSSDGSIVGTGSPGDDCVGAIIHGEMKENVLREYYCDQNNKTQYVHYECPNGCVNGACIQ